MRFFVILCCIVLSGCWSSDSANTNDGKTNDDKKLSDKAEKYCHGNQPKDDIISKANNGDVNKQLAMGLVYDAGYCGVQDLKVAESWYLKSASQGYDNAQMALGALYISDEHYHQYKYFNVEQAQYWLNKAIAQNNSSAMFYMSVLYCDERYGVEDLVACKYWLEKAAEFGNPKAIEILSDLPK